MKIGAMELIVIFIVALLVIGPDKLPHYARKLGAALREFRKVSSDVTKGLRESVIDPLEEAQKPLREAMEPLETIGKSVTADLNAVEKDLKNIGKNKPREEKPAAPAEEAPPAAPAQPESAPAPEADSAAQATEEKGGQSA